MKRYRVVGRVGSEGMHGIWLMGCLGKKIVYFKMKVSEIIGSGEGR